MFAKDMEVASSHLPFGFLQGFDPYGNSARNPVGPGWPF